jgi:integrase
LGCFDPYRGLQWADIDFKGRFLEVKRSVVAGRVETPKNGKTRRIDMSLQLASVLWNHLQRMKQETLKQGWRDTPLWVFCNSKGLPLDYHNVRERVFYKMLAKAGLRKVRIHDLRHTFASLLIHNGESLAYVKDQLGHHSIQITVETYGHLVPGGNRHAVDRLDDPAWGPDGSKMVAEGFINPKEDQLRLKRLEPPGGFEPPTY